MANEKFKVKFGLAVGDTSATIDAATGNIVTLGDIDVQGGNITNTLGPVDITSGVAGNITIQPNTTGDIILASDTVYVGDSGVAAAITTNGNASLTIANGSGGSNNIIIDPTSGTTVNDGNLILGQVNTAAVLTTNGTGNLDIRTGSWPTSANITLADGVNGNITVDTDGSGQVIINAKTDIDELQVDNININNNDIISTNTDGNINIVPNGTGDVYLSTDVVYVGDANATAFISTNGTGNLVLNTNANVNSGSITIAQGVNGNLTLAPNGTGDLVLTFNNGGNLTNSRNYVFGAVRNSTTEGLGDIWALNVASAITPTRGISIDNSADTAKTASYLARTYGSNAGTRSRLIFERSRGTAASPSQVLLGDLLGEVDATGYSSTGWVNDTLTAVPGFFGFTALENWVSNTNLGTGFALTLAPTATTIATAANLIPTIQSSPQTNYFRADRLAIGQGKTARFGATGCSTSGTTLTIGTLSSGTIATGQVLTFTTATATGIYIVANISGSGSGSTWTISEDPGTLSAQSITGHAGFIAGATAATSTDVLQNLKLIKNTIQSSGGTTQIVTSSAGATLELRGDNIQLEDAAGTSIVGSAITYNRVYGQFQYDTTVTPVAADTAYVFPLGTADINNIATVGSTSRLIAGAAGIYNLQFSVQVDNADNSNDHDAYIWLRKNGSDVVGSMGRTTVTKNNAGSLKIIAWNYLVSSANTTDYWEIAYAVSDTDVTFPAFASTAFGPSTACIITSLTPVGA